MPTLVSTSRRTATAIRARVSTSSASCGLKGLTLEGVASAHASEVFLLGHDQLGERDTLIRIRIRQVFLEVLVRYEGL